MNATLSQMLTKKTLHPLNFCKALSNSDILSEFALSFVENVLFEVEVKKSRFLIGFFVGIVSKTPSSISLAASSELWPLGNDWP